MDLSTLGWNPTRQQQFDALAADGQCPARITQEHKEAYLVATAAGETAAEVTGRLRHNARGRADFPAVGDWVAVTPHANSRATIHAILPRTSRFARKVAGDVTDEQIIAANVDTVLLVAGLDGDFNLRRIERLVTLAYESGAAPVIVLNKADLCADIDARVGDVQDIAIGITVHVVSAREGQGLESVAALVRPGQTLALLGSSGVGKSSIINALCGTERMRVNAVRADDSRGRHTTTHRELVVMPGGGIIIDTPGMRELQLWGDDDAGVRQTFDDVEALAARCRFRDCRHEAEPGCAVRAALETGELDPGRLASYEKQRRELAHLQRKMDVHARKAEEARWKRITMNHRARTRVDPRFRDR